MPIRRGSQASCLSANMTESELGGDKMPRGSVRDSDSPFLVSSPFSVSSVNSGGDPDSEADTPSTPRVIPGCPTEEAILPAPSQGISPSASESTKAPQADRPAPGATKPQAPSTWSCRFCEKDPDDPVTTLCGHIFCHRYVTSRIRRMTDPYDSFPAASHKRSRILSGAQLARPQF